MQDYNWWQKENIWLEIGVGITDSSSVITISVYFPRSSPLRTRIRFDERGFWNPNLNLFNEEKISLMGPCSRSCFGGQTSMLCCNLDVQLLNS
ncbi:hypothetical protein TanjilG_23278 [Lupinus angustifolius]|uniref:Uncharacterized protein n=1 Tax=Lupinus angustifolius TaxID=3871 RepID=A0A1J7FZ75_LUPAN|nr:hypothetical protein TanjilG_23278 [Lupinus angustifolius]